LIRGEPDASSFPSGSLRESFEARGYTVWDYTSPVFVKEDGDNVTLFIPSAFCSYSGEALDNKTPLLRSNDAINREALRVLHALGKSGAKRVHVTVGAEQEYFLVDRKHFEQRIDLMQTDRTLFGAPSPKGMAMNVHYFGSMHERVASFMHELNTELWKLGISAKTQHHEISPHQFEIAQVFVPANVAADRNQLTMEALRKVAERHEMVCLLHDKPFASLGGSGKHINWSLATDDGTNLLEPGDTPQDNEVFMVLLCAVIRAVDKYAPLMRASIASAGNDHRMGAMEAPPAIVSLFIGDQLDQILSELATSAPRSSKATSTIRLGVSSLPQLPRDLTDRNRTSPFAFTGNKFELRGGGSAVCVAIPVFILNTIIAEVLKEIADELERTRQEHAAAQRICRRIVSDHRRIIFNGDNYSDEWIAEAKRRGLPNLRNSVEAYGAVLCDEMIDMFERQRVLRRDEYQARMDTSYQCYALALLIESRCTINIAARQILPAAIEHVSRVASAAKRLEAVQIDNTAERRVLENACAQVSDLQEAISRLATEVCEVEQITGARQRATAARDRLLPGMADVRRPADALEGMVDATLWPLPIYAQMVSRL